MWDKSECFKVPKLDARLMCAAELVRQNICAADIGTDHGYLPAYLILSGKCKKVVASDINRSPLEKCRKTADLFGVSDKMEFCIADGLEGLPLEKNNVGDIIICGMGGELVSKIIDKSDYTRKPGVRLILGPMSSIPELRTYLSEKGYDIIDERICCASGKLYQIILTEYTGITYNLSISEKYVGRINLSRRSDPLLKRLLEENEVRVQTKLSGKIKGGQNTDEENELLQQIRSVLENL